MSIDGLALHSHEQRQNTTRVMPIRFIGIHTAAPNSFTANRAIVSPRKRCTDVSLNSWNGGNWRHCDAVVRSSSTPQGSLALAVHAPQPRIASSRAAAGYSSHSAAVPAWNT
jgi:hypothetical protein